MAALDALLEDLRARLPQLAEALQGSGMASFALQVLAERAAFRESTSSLSDKALDRERERYQELIFARPLPAGLANEFIAELLAHLTLRDPAFAAAARLRLLQMQIIGPRLEDPALVTTRLGPTPVRITPPPVGRRGVIPARGAALAGLIHDLKVAERLGARDRDAVRGRQLEAFGPLLGEFWAGLFPDRRPLDPATRRDLCATNSIEQVAVRFAALAWGVSPEHVKRWILPGARRLAGAARERPRPGGSKGHRETAPAPQAEALRGDELPRGP
jgi:hypothetical protein